MSGVGLTALDYASCCNNADLVHSRLLSSGDQGSLALRVRDVASECQGSWARLVAEEALGLTQCSEPEFQWQARWSEDNCSPVVTEATPTSSTLPPTSTTQNTLTEEEVAEFAKEILELLQLAVEATATSESPQTQ